MNPLHLLIHALIHVLTPTLNKRTAKTTKTKLGCFNESPMGSPNPLCSFFCIWGPTDLRPHPSPHSPSTRARLGFSRHRPPPRATKETHLSDREDYLGDMENLCFDHDFDLFSFPLPPPPPPPSPFPYTCSVRSLRPVPKCCLVILSHFSLLPLSRAALSPSSHGLQFVRSSYPCCS